MSLHMANPNTELPASKSKKRKTSSNVNDGFKEEKSSSTSAFSLKTAKNNKFSLSLVILFLLGTLTSVLIAQLIPVKNLESSPEATPANNVTSATAAHIATKIMRPTFTMYTKKHKSKQKNLSIIRKILKLFGYTEVGIDDDWNLLWGFETPFPAEKKRIMNLKPHQMVNHMPGMNFIATKVVLSTSGSPFMPRAFKLPKEKNDFLNYAAEHPDKIFVEKGNGHRNVEIKKVKDINLNSTSTFVQEFLTSPYLVDGYKFDIGVYTVITSIDPVRLYIYTGDVMFRYCQKKFHPFDPNVLQKYVVGDDYRPTWKVPSLKKYFKRYGGSMRASFDAYVRDQGQNPSKIWEQAEEIIRYTVTSQAEKMAARFEPYPIKNFYELIRVERLRI